MNPKRQPEDGDGVFEAEARFRFKHPIGAKTTWKQLVIALLTLIAALATAGVMVYLNLKVQQ